MLDLVNSGTKNFAAVFWKTQNSWDFFHYDIHQKTYKMWTVIVLSGTTQIYCFLI